MTSKAELIKLLDQSIANVRTEDAAAKAAGRIARGEGEVDVDAIITPDAGTVERP